MMSSNLLYEKIHWFQWKYLSRRHYSIGVCVSESGLWPSLGSDTESSFIHYVDGVIDKWKRLINESVTSDSLLLQEHYRGFHYFSRKPATFCFHSHFPSAVLYFLKTLIYFYYQIKMSPNKTPSPNISFNFIAASYLLLSKPRIQTLLCAGWWTLHLGPEICTWALQLGPTSIPSSKQDQLMTLHSSISKFS